MALPVGIAPLNPTAAGIAEKLATAPVSAPIPFADNAVRASQVGNALNDDAKAQAFQHLLDSQYQGVQKVFGELSPEEQAQVGDVSHLSSPYAKEDDYVNFYQRVQGVKNRQALAQMNQGADYDTQVSNAERLGEIDTKTGLTMKSPLNAAKVLGVMAGAKQKDAAAAKAEADAAYTAGAKTDKAKADMALAGAKTDTEKERPDLIRAETARAQAQAAKARVEAAIQNFSPDSPKVTQAAQDLAAGKLTLQQLGKITSIGKAGGAMRMAIYNQARQLNPNFNPADFDAGFKSYENAQNKKTVSLVNNALPNIDKLIALSDKVSRAGAPLVNGPLLKAKFGFGDEDVALLENAHTLMTDELNQIFAGASGGSDMLRQMSASLIDQRLDPATFRRTMEQVKDFLLTRRQSVTDQFGVYGPGGSAGATFGPSAGERGTAPASPGAAPGPGKGSLQVGKYKVTVH